MKRFLNKLNDSELTQVYYNNKKIQENVYLDQKENDNLFAEEQYNMLLEDARGHYTCHDNYGSYYLRLNDLEGYYFLNCMSFGDLHDYSIVEDTTIEDIKKTMKAYEDIDYSIATDNEIDSLQDKLDELAKQVLEGIEKYLHEIEDAYYTDAELIEMFLDGVGNGWYDDIYVLDNSYIAYRDYTECYK